MNRSLATHPLFVASVWLAGYCLAIVIAVEQMLGEITPAAMQMMAKVLAYVGAMGNAGFTLVMLTFFTVAGGWMLRWLGTAVSVRTLARLVAGSCWPFALFAWCMAGMVAATPPRGLTVEEVAEVADAPPAADDLFGLPWLTEAQYTVLVLFLAILGVSLARRCGWFNALISIAAGIATVTVITAALMRLSTLHQG